MRINICLKCHEAKKKKEQIFKTNPYIVELVHRAHGFFPLGELSIMSRSVLYPPPEWYPTLAVQQPLLHAHSPG